MLKELEEKMLEASAAMNFEEAAMYRDLMNSVQAVTQKQKITSDDQQDRDLVAMARGGDEAVVQVFFIRGGKIIGREHYYLTGVEGEPDASVLSAFIKQMYAGTPYIPKEIWLEEEVEDGESILEWLSEKRGRRVYFRTPKRGQKEKLLELAKRNAFYGSDQRCRETERAAGKDHWSHGRDPGITANATHPPGRVLRYIQY